MESLTVLDFAGKNIRFERRGDRVWVSLTDMAKATGKLVADYTRSRYATEFLGELESIMGILVMVPNVGGATETTGTWAIEEVAIEFAAWCSVGFRIWVTQQIRTLMAEGVVTIAPAREPVKVELTPAKLDLLRSAMSSVPTPLVDGFILSRVQFHYPELKADINAAHGLLAATNPIPELLLTPTAIGDRLGVSARVVNALLTENGYQTKDHAKSKTEPAYLLTELGDQHSSDSTSYQHTKWQESIVEVLRTLM